MAVAMNEQLHAEEWLLARLRSDATLAGYVDTVDSGLFSTRQRMPVIRVDPQEPEDVRVIGVQRILTHVILLVRAYSKGPDWSEVRPIADRIDALLHDATGTSATVRVTCYREEPFIDTEVYPDGRVYRAAGGIYHLLVEHL